jgi:hypothetical protein
MRPRVVCTLPHIPFSAAPFYTPFSAAPFYTPFSAAPFHIPFSAAPSLQGEQGVQLELLKSDSYDDVSKALAAKLGLDHPLKLRFTGALRVGGGDGNISARAPVMPCVSCMGLCSLGQQRCVRCLASASATSWRGALPLPPTLLRVPPSTCADPDSAAPHLFVQARTT